MAEDEGVRFGVFAGTPSEHSTATRALAGEADARAVADAVAACRTWWRVGAAPRRMVSVICRSEQGRESERGTRRERGRVLYSERAPWYSVAFLLMQRMNHARTAESSLIIWSQLIARFSLIHSHPPPITPALASRAAASLATRNAIRRAAVSPAAPGSLALPWRARARPRR